MPVYPFTHNHRRHTIDPDDDLIHDASPDGDRVDDDQTVTVANLLDARYALPNHYDDCAEWDHYDATWAKSSKSVSDAALRILCAIRYRDDAASALNDLSPSERAEFDRRTGADRD